jgi:hypothetical protein
MAPRIGFLLGSIALFGVMDRLVERLLQQSRSTPLFGIYAIAVPLLLAVSVLLAVVGTTILALRFKGSLRWAIAGGAALCISFAAFLDLRGQVGIGTVAVLYFAPQLLLLFVVGKRRVPHP